jgi:hypothetical protein
MSAVADLSDDGLPDLVVVNVDEGTYSVLLNKGPTGGIPWTNVGYGLAGTDGVPCLAATGTLLAGSSGALSLSHAAPNAPCLLVIAPAIVPTPFKCGTLVPDPEGLKRVLVTTAGGDVDQRWSNFPAGLSGVAFELQCAVLDAAAACGVSLSNALKGTIP